MNEHVPDDLLAAFVEGEVGEQLAIHIAEHLDSCPACATRAVGMEPLAAAFAAMPDPAIPTDLTAAVLAAAEAPERSRVPTTEIAVGLGLLVAAFLLFVALGDPVGSLNQSALWMRALASAGDAIRLGLPAPAILLPATLVLGGASAVLFARVAWPDALTAAQLRLAGRSPGGWS
jgi:anti-sigma factor RsiW